MNINPGSAGVSPALGLNFSTLRAKERAGRPRSQDFFLGEGGTERPVRVSSHIILPVKNST